MWSQAKSELLPQQAQEQIQLELMQQQQQQQSAHQNSQWHSMPLQNGVETGYRDNYQNAAANFECDALPVKSAVPQPTRALPLRYNPFGRLSSGNDSPRSCGVTSESQYHSTCGNNYHEMQFAQYAQQMQRAQQWQQFAQQHHMPNGQLIKTERGLEFVPWNAYQVEQFSRWYNLAGHEHAMANMTHNMQR